MRTPHKHILAVLTIGNLLGQILIWAIAGIIGLKVNVWILLPAVVWASLCAVSCGFKKSGIEPSAFDGTTYRSARQAQHSLDHRHEIECHEVSIKPDGDSGFRRHKLDRGKTGR